MADLEPITREEMLLDGQNLEPITRKEMFIKRIYDKTQVIPEPITREEIFLKKAGDETTDVTIEQLTATENRTYSEEGVAYSPVIVNVPQTTLTTLDVTENGTYTAPSGTAYDEVEVDVPLPDNAYLLKEIENVEIATFTDGSSLPMPKLEVAIEPQQDLHGYDAPWAGGVGKNKLENKLTTRTYNGVTATVKDNGTVTLTGTATQATNFFLNTNLNLTGNYTISGCPSGGSEDSYYMNALIGSWGAKGKDTGNGIYSDGGTITNVAITVANGYSFPSGGITFKPMIESGNTKTSYEPYSNICPISGWDEVNVTRCGKNWCPVDSGEVKAGNLVTFSTPLPSGTYSVSFKCTRTGSSSDSASMIIYDKDDNAYSAKVVIPNTGDRLNIENLTCNNGISRIYFYSIAGSWGSSQNYTLGITEFQVEQGSATSYSPYNGHTYTIPFTDAQGNPITVYGGECDVVNGTVKPNIEYDSYNGETLVGRWISDRDVYAEGTTPTIGAQVVDLGAYGSDISVQPTSIKSIEGVNNVWGDCGQILEGEYFSKEA